MYISAGEVKVARRITYASDYSGVTQRASRFPFSFSFHFLARCRICMWTAGGFARTSTPTPLPPPPWFFRWKNLPGQLSRRCSKFLGFRAATPAAPRVYSQLESYFQSGRLGQGHCWREHSRQRVFISECALDKKSLAVQFFLGRPKQLINDRDHRRGETRRQWRRRVCSISSRERHRSSFSKTFPRVYESRPRILSDTFRLF